MTTTTTIPGRRISELVRYFLRLGFLGFGGPVALVGQMERELVDERKWLTKEQMREAMAICQSLPGPLAIQVPPRRDGSETRFAFCYHALFASSLHHTAREPTAGTDMLISACIRLQNRARPGMANRINYVQRTTEMAKRLVFCFDGTWNTLDAEHPTNVLLFSFSKAVGAQTN